MIEDLLLRRASTLRTYLEGQLSGTHLRVYNYFPKGTCKVSSLLFLKWIGDTDGIKTGFGVANAVRGTEGSEQSHAWAEVEGCIVDITADQFSDFNEPVFVGRTSGWHRTWRGMKRYPHDEFTTISGAHLQEYQLLLRSLGP